MKGKQDFAFVEGHHRITTASTVPILLSIDHAPEHVIPSGNSSFTLRLDDPANVQLDPADAKKEYRFDVKSWQTRPSEATDDRPIPNPPAPNNFLKKLRVQVRRQMGLTREDFADRPAIYEVEGNFEDVPFEETERRAYEQAQGDAEASPDGGESTQDEHQRDGDGNPAGTGSERQDALPGGKTGD